MTEDGVGPRDPYGEGMEAHSRRIPRDACPYADAGDDRAGWLAGWDRQQLNEGDFSAIE